MGLEIVFERTYPPSTTEFTSVVRAMQAANPDVVFAATLPIDTVGHHPRGQRDQFKPKIIGGAMLGLLVTGIKQQLGPMINGYISNEFYIPAPSLQFAGTKEMMAEYQKRAQDLASIRWATPIRPMPMRRARFSRKAVTATKSLNDDDAGRISAARQLRHGDRPDLVRTGRRMDHSRASSASSSKASPAASIEPVHGLVAAGRGLSARIQGRAN